VKRQVAAHSTTATTRGRLGGDQVLGAATYSSNSAVVSRDARGAPGNNGFGSATRRSRLLTCTSTGSPDG
jgi:hypothetical protein